MIRFVGTFFIFFQIYVSFISWIFTPRAGTVLGRIEWLEWRQRKQLREQMRPSQLPFAAGLTPASRVSIYPCVLYAGKERMA